MSIRTRIFLVDVSGATDISKADPQTSLQTLAPRVAKKRLLLDREIIDANGENVEGICLGPQLGPRSWAIIAVVDDTDGPFHVSTSRVVVYELTLAAE
jgi:hypothetical protein